MAIFDRQTNGLLTDGLMQIAAGDANRDRNRVYKQKVAGPYNGPRILAEGDSWFCYPQPEELLFPVVSAAPLDLVRQLNKEFAIFTEAVPGDTAWGMRQTVAEPHGLAGLIAYYEPDILLFSAGGNDMLGNARLASTLLKGPKSTPAKYFGAKFATLLDDIFGHYSHVLTTALAARPQMKAVLHSYAYARVTGPGRGPWLHDPMVTLGIPESHRNGVVKEIVDRFHQRQQALCTAINAATPQEPRVFLADTRRDVPDSEWFDEIHPSSKGFKAVARTIRAAILQAWPLTV